MRVRPGADAHRIDGLVRDDLGPVAVSLRDVQFLRRLLARRQTTVGNADNLDAVLRAQARNVPRPRIGAGADDTNAECVCCHGWFILVRATFGMAREEYSTIVTGSLAHFHLLIPVARSDDSSRRLQFVLARLDPATCISTVPRDVAGSSPAMTILE